MSIAVYIRVPPTRQGAGELTRRVRAAMEYLATTGGSAPLLFVDTNYDDDDARPALMRLLRSGHKQGVTDVYLYGWKDIHPREQRVVRNFLNLDVTVHLHQSREWKRVAHKHLIAMAFPAEARQDK